MFEWPLSQTNSCLYIKRWIISDQESTTIKSRINWKLTSFLIQSTYLAPPAVVGYDHPIKGQGIWAYVTLIEGIGYDGHLKKELVMAVRETTGPFAAPDVIHWAPAGFSKTRSGKIMRRVLRKIAAYEEDQLGDVSTLADPSVVEDLIDRRDDAHEKE